MYKGQVLKDFTIDLFQGMALAYTTQLSSDICFGAREDCVGIDTR